ncbi:DUF3027 domain-containing protein [Microbacterium sp.]|uniref:DUF3027 domain-containing protein n=1 Tax=Microbacterium sp. TaxID=51671 RepID=UPI00262924B8|nr:DUF3027 domain-containing protein [Microbacterium sp.]
MPEADERLTGAHDLALAALYEITPASTVGPAAGYIVEDDGSVSLRFENRLPGYPGWYWTVTVARVDDAEPTVLEAELMPAEGALLAPDWVPWAERLAEYRAHQAELAEQAAASAAEISESDDDADSGDADDDADDDDIDDDDEDVPESRVLHAGDLDGVDIDELDDSVSDDSDGSDESDDSDADDVDSDDSDDDAASDEEE